MHHDLSETGGDWMQEIFRNMLQYEDSIQCACVDRTNEPVQLLAWLLCVI